MAECCRRPAGSVEVAAQFGPPGPVGRRTPSPGRVSPDTETPANSIARDEERVERRPQQPPFCPGAVPPGRGGWETAHEQRHGRRTGPAAGSNSEPPLEARRVGPAGAIASEFGLAALAPSAGGGPATGGPGPCGVIDRTTASAGRAAPAGEMFANLQARDRGRQWLETVRGLPPGLRFGIPGVEVLGPPT